MSIYSIKRLNGSELNKSIAIALMMLLLLPISQSAAEARKANGKMEKITSFNYHQSGGFAAINKTYSVKLADLSKEDREELEKLIVKSGLLAMKSDKKTTPGAADMFFYEFTASDGGEHSATYDDGQLPDSFRPLVEYAQARASSSR